MNSVTNVQYVYNQSGNASSFDVEKISTQLTPTTVINNTITATLEDENGNPIQNAEIIVKNSTGNAVASGYTDENGIAILSLNRLILRTYALTIQYNTMETIHTTMQLLKQL